MNNTRERILEVAAELFGRYGYEAVTMEMIARELKVKAPALYKHYSGKQEIYDVLFDRVKKYYDRQGILQYLPGTGDEPDMMDIITPDVVIEHAMKDLDMILHDPFVVSFRKMMMLEQFRDPTMAALKVERTYSSVLDFFILMMKRQIEMGKLKDEDPVVMAMELSFPVNYMIDLIYADPMQETYAREMIQRHIRQFFRVYGVDRGE